MSTSAKKTKVILVHGVGFQKAEEISGAASKMLGEYGLTSSDVSEFNWCNLVPSPRTNEGTLSWTYLCTLGRCSLGAAVAEFSPARKSGLWRRLLITLSRFFGGIFVALSAVLPLIPAWGLLAGLSWLSLWLAATPRFQTFGASLGRLIEFFVHPDVVIYCSFLVKYLLIGVIACAMGVIVCKALSQGTAGLFQGMRFITIKLIWGAILPVALLAFLGVSGIVSLILIVSMYLAYMISVQAGDFFEDAAGPFWSLGAMAGAACLVAATWVVTASARRQGMHLFKILADVLYYAAGPQHRADVQEKFARFLAIELTGGYERLVLVGHSLGSVIVSDCLCRAPTASFGGAEIVFLTMGSPLGRLFARFFPEQCPKPAALARYLHQRIPSAGPNRWQARLVALGDRESLHVPNEGRVDGAH